MRVNIGFIVICASLVATVASGWILNSGSDGLNVHDGYPVRSIGRREAESEVAKVPEKAEEQTSTTYAPEPFRPQGSPEYCKSLYTEDMYVTQDHQTEEQRQRELRDIRLMVEIKRILCVHRQKKADEAARAAAAGEQPRDIIREFDAELARAFREVDGNRTAQVSEDTVTPQTATTMDPLDEPDSHGRTLSPEQKEEERRMEALADRIRKRLGMPQKWTANQKTLRTQGAQGREIDDDVADVGTPENVGDQEHEDLVKLAEQFSTSINAGIPKNKVRRSVEFDDAVSPRASNLKNPNKVGAGSLRAGSPGDLIDDAIAFAPGTLSNRKHSNKNHSAAHKDSPDARNRRGARVCKRVCSWRPESESMKEVEQKPRKTPEVEQQKESERGPHNSYMNFPELNVQYRNNH